jgi:hypothetical protein
MKPKVPWISPSRASGMNELRKPKVPLFKPSCTSSVVRLGNRRFPCVDYNSFYIRSAIGHLAQKKDGCFILSPQFHYGRSVYCHSLDKVISLGYNAHTKP